MEILIKSVLLQVGLLLLCKESFQKSNMSFEETPKDVRAQLSEDVPLLWTFSYGSDSTKIAGPWNYHGVEEISFGIWESFGEFRYIKKKLIAVDNNGNITLRQGYEKNLSWTTSKFNMSFILIQVSLKDQGQYGIHAEVGVACDPLRNSLEVNLGASRQMDDSVNSKKRNVTWYLNEPAALMFRRVANEESVEYFHYRIYKKNISVIAMKKGSNGSHCTKHTAYSEECDRRYELCSFNTSHMSFYVNNVSKSDEGYYRIETYFKGVGQDLDPNNEFIALKVQVRTSESPRPKVINCNQQLLATTIPDTTASDVGSGGEQGIALPLRLLSLMAIFLWFVE